MIRVNGKERTLRSEETVATLLGQLGFTGRFALVEVNGEPVERERYADRRLAEGDVVVVARPVAGG